MMKAQLLLSLMKQRRRLKERERWNREQLKSYQSQALDRLRAFVYARSPFYQKFHEGLFQAPLGQLPILTKSLLMENFDELVTDRNIHLEEIRKHLKRVPEEERYNGRYWVSLTSGSTGHPCVNLFNLHEWAVVLASGTRSYDWAGVRVRPFHPTRAAAIVSSKPSGMTARVTSMFHLWWFPTLRMFPTESLSHIVERLNEWQPEILQAFSYMASMLAEEQLAGRLQISPRVIATGGDLMTRAKRQQLEAVWKGCVFDRYACGEVGVVASECSQHGGLHFYEDLAIVEVVDQSNRPVSPGERGSRVLVTSLTKYTQPLIRYELPDGVRMSVSPCACGRSFGLVEELQGRTEEMLRLPSIHQGQVALPPDIFHRIMDQLPIIGWQVIQEAAGLDILLRQVPEDFSDEGLVNSIQLALSEMGAVVPPIKVKRVSHIPCAPNGKAPLIISHIEHPGNDGSHSLRHP